MIFQLRISIIALILIQCIVFANCQELINWKFKSSKDSIWRPFNFPGNSHSALLENKMIQDPFYSDNEKKLQWIGEEDWEFKSEFTVEKKNLQNEVDLYLERIDTYAEIFINGRKVTELNNAFRIYFLSVKNFLEIGRNVLLIKIKSADIVSKNKYDRLDVKLPGEERVTSRKPQYHYGWDFGPKYISSGLNGKIKLLTYKTIRLEDQSLLTKSISESNANLELFILVNSTKSQIVNLNLSVGESNFTFEHFVQNGRNEIRIPIEIKNPKLWWPNGMGESFLYKCKLEIGDGEDIVLSNWNCGIRTIKLISEMDSLGQSFYFRVNGLPMFAKGANYIPHDIFQSYPNNSERIEYLIRSAKDCNFNMLRVWGGGNYESEQFYELCDKHGIVVWQDFMFACGMYPGDQRFLENVVQEAEDQCIRLSKYACIGLWCGNNENNEGWHRWGWQIGKLPKTQDRLWNDYKKLFQETLPQVVDHYSNFNNYWESSPLYGRGDKRFNTNGDAHDWGLWHDELPFTSLKDRVPRFMSEFGFQSIPSLNTISKIADSKDFSLESKSMLAHQKHPRGNKLILQYIKTDFNSPRNFKELIYLNQLTQAEGISLGIQYHRMSKPYCMGSLYWQYNDCWPGISWSGIDYYGKWKALQYYTKEVFNPILIAITDKGDGNFILQAVNDGRDSVNLNLSLELSDFFGNVLWTKDIKGVIGIDSASILSEFSKNDFSSNFNEESFYIKVRNGNTVVKNYFFKKFKDLKLPKAVISISSEPVIEKSALNLSYPYEFRISVQSNVFVRAFAYISEEDIVLSDNFFDLEPNAIREFTIYSKQKDLNIANLDFISLNQLLN
jgi:beta-mannosidase